jgi:DNA-binding response OmpR family regulator
MIDSDGKSLARVRSQMKRALIVEPSQPSARLLADLLRSMSGCESWMAATTDQALGLARTIEPQLIFTEHGAQGLDGVAFSRALRRSDFACRMVPVIMITSEATAAAILGARDAGVHEFLRKPYTIKDLVRRLEAVLLQGRGWIEAMSYIGPDRRRFNSGDYQGARKRRTDPTNQAAPHRDTIGQALKIVRAAMRASEADPSQALRALTAQAQDLRKAAVASGDLKLLDASADLERYLVQVRHGVPLSLAQLETATARLWPFLPPEEDSAAA